MRLIFLSDLHLSQSTIEQNTLFYKLLNTWQQQNTTIYILGDFFDSWIGDDDSNEFLIEMKSQLKNYTLTNNIYFIHGNHDFALGRNFACETGIKYLKDCSTIELGSKKALLSHGDVFCSLDKSYQRMKKILRNPFLITILKMTSITFRRQLKEYLVKKSATSFNIKPKHTYLTVDNTVIKIANKAQAGIVIHGHTHNPGKYMINNKITRFEIPDWSDRKAGGYIIFANDELNICYE